MTYPPGVVTRTITVGDSLAVESGTGLTVRAALRSSRGLVWCETDIHPYVARRAVRACRE